MFTGLVQGTGKVTALTRRGAQMRLGVRADFDLPRIVLGESIAVNGVCLTVEEAASNAFFAYASAETMEKTNLGELAMGSLVNLERALALGDRLGGHLVSGHVDCLARVESSAPAGESVRYTLAFPERFGVFVVEKGSVCLDGVSLTVNACGQDWLSVNVIPATQAETTIDGWCAGRAVNMECDLIGKYVARMLEPFAAKSKPSAITEEFLRNHGF
ncbi:Riboflavin synthase [Fundidesulfovibrio magnetotacticus]|uniref:Riboflavin synthase n=1 Tax=Fundidesulfovibrio magnetotacticus TaxID=2730080 RepID=A0A6V8LPW9_9BACT|nr:riboflavin synthase [Fundidesulfovibrio magnetotacticus]GFK93764.1 Riboflavin synthase [Fundidesulfovibrio magnetotacticus]